MKIRRTVVATALVALLAIAAVVAAGVVAAPPQAKAADPVVLTVAGNGQTRTFTMTELKALTSYSGYFGFVNSAGTIYPPEPVTGVRLSDVLAQIGGMTTLNACDITATDNYGMTYTYDQIVNNNGVQFYNATTKAAEDPKAPWTWVLVWEQNGAPLPADVGPLRLVAAQETDVNQVADGHLMVKWVDRVTLRGAVAEWKVRMYGLKRKNGTRQTYTLDRTTYDSCATPGCHGSSWVSPPPRRAGPECRSSCSSARSTAARARQLQRLQRGAGDQGVPHQARGGDGQVRHPHLESGKAPHEAHPRQQAHGLRSRRAGTTRCASSGPRSRCRAVSPSAASARSSCSPSDGGGPKPKMGP